MKNKWFIIANPTSGKGFVKSQRAKFLQQLSLLDLPYEVVFTEYSKHEIELVQNALKIGFRKFISVGGDGTLHHVVNGIMLQNSVDVSEISIAVIPLGTGNDWIKHYNIPNQIEKAIQIINVNKTITQDIGKITIEDSVTYFNNSAGIGFDGFVVNSLKKYKKFGSASYLIASIMGFLTYKKSTLKLQYNNKILNSKMLMLTIGICKFSGGGMRLTSQPNAQDGLFDILAIKNISMWSLILNIKKMYNGKLGQHKKTETDKSSEIQIEFIKGELPYIQADGELLGQGSFNVSLLKNALNFVIY
jgi:YegS/Rv2252/BmrU family lipid kinase